MNAREAGLLAGLEAHEWHLLFNWTDRSGDYRRLCPWVLVRSVAATRQGYRARAPLSPACC